jgi:hypothetical protein
MAMKLPDSITLPHSGMRTQGFRGLVRVLYDEVMKGEQMSPDMAHAVLAQWRARKKR